MRSLRFVLVLGVVGISGAIGGGVAAAAPHASRPPAVHQLVGTLRLTPGSCAHGSPAGSYLAVTFGTRAIRNFSSGCGGGAYTLLSPGSNALSTQRFSPSITEPARFDGNDLSLGTASQNLFASPQIYLIGKQIAADVRSVQAAYGGGEWQVGAQHATGSYDARTHQLELQWLSGQSFTAASAATGIHLSGRFTGVLRRVPPGTTVDLGTESFAAGKPAGAVHTVAEQSPSGAKGARRAGGHRKALRLAAQHRSTTNGSPRTFLVAELLVLLNAVAFVALARRRSGR
jgi:hypothetical protein